MVINDLHIFDRMLVIGDSNTDNLLFILLYITFHFMHNSKVQSTNEIEAWKSWLHTTGLNNGKQTGWWGAFFFFLNTTTRCQALSRVCHHMTFQRHWKLYRNISRSFLTGKCIKWMKQRRKVKEQCDRRSFLNANIHERFDLTFTFA